MRKDPYSLLNSENISSTTMLPYYRGVELPGNLSRILTDFYNLLGCPACFVDFTDRSVFSKGWHEKPNVEICRGKGKLFSEKDSNDKGLREIQYSDSCLGTWMPILVKKRVIGYFVVGQYIMASNSCVDDKIREKKRTGDAVYLDGNIRILSQKEKTDILHKASRFVEAISNQFTYVYDLKEEIRKNKETANQLRVQKSFFENLFDHSPDAILILDNEDKVLRANQEFLHLFEYSLEEIIDQKINDFIIPERYKNEQVISLKNLAADSSVDVTTIRQTKLGKQIHVQLRGKPIVLDDNQLAFCVIYRNLTQQIWNQKCQQVMLRISEILNSSMNSIAVINHIGKELQQIVGAGKLFLELISPDRRCLRSFIENDEEFKEVNISESLSSLVIRERETLYLDNSQIDELMSSNQILLGEIPKRWLGIPLIAEDQVIGVFGVACFVDGSELNSESIDLMKTLSVQLATGVIKKTRDQELRMFQRALEQSPASILITDVKGNIEYVNPKFCDVTGYGFKEVLGKNPRFLKSGNTSDSTYREMWKTVLAGGEWHGEFLNVKKSNELFWETANLSAVKDELGRITHIVSVKEDITRTKKFQKELLESKNRAEESDRLKSAFLANMSHELRTPLNAVIGFSNLCDESLSINEILEFVGLINKSGNQLLGIIEDILSFTSIESENFQIGEEEFFMLNFLDEVEKIAKTKQVQENKECLGLQFKPDENYTAILVKSDYQRLMQVVTNLIKNALKFTNEGFVEFGYHVQGDELSLYVKDTGVGIEQGKKDIIFDKFRQADDSIARTFGGTGMGLAIAKKIMDMLDGSIQVESEPNKGSIFTLKLNCVISKSNSKIEMMSENTLRTLNLPLILVAEDEISNFKLIEAILKRNSYEVIRAENGAEAVEICRDNSNISLVLMDIRMPIMDGLIATKKIKSFKPNLPIIAQTAYAMDGDENKALEEGCNDYISKPIRRDLLLEKLSALL
ncbi:PAS domain S-box protein [Labilibaculum sp.]|uniref:PAS domain S-box protein n=1 Tax=Labilibaculum sp. TaxID=2060723 RepID=UPI00356154C0